MGSGKNMVFVFVFLTKLCTCRFLVQVLMYVPMVTDYLLVGSGYPRSLY
jgi:hypothetical protein